MTSRVLYSAFSWAITVITTVGLIVCMVFCYHVPAAFFILLAVLLLLYIPALFFNPTYISADAEEISIHSPFKNRTIPMAEVIEVKRYKPLPSTIRICASGGFLGYWGTFRDCEIGTYKGFWGKDDDCFLLTLRNGKKYLLGCTDPDEMTVYIQTLINSKNKTR